MHAVSANSPSHYDEADFLPISGLQHLVFCERQCALIHIERLWVENKLTAEGRLLHQRIDLGQSEARSPVRVARSVQIRSTHLGLTGRADVVELRRGVDDAVPKNRYASVPGLRGLWQPTPIEYKRGEPKYTDCDRVQLCAQAICLEEMLGVTIPRAILFYARRWQRVEVELDEALRAFTTEAAQRFHELVSQGCTPAAFRQPKCQGCSLLDRCLPHTRRRRSVARYLRREFFTEANPGIHDRAPK